MTTEQILKVLKTEKECIERQGTDKCDKRCGWCELCLPDKEILDVYDYLISGYELTEIPISISKEESEVLLALLKRSSFAVYPVPEVGESYPAITVTTEGDTE